MPELPEVETVCRHLEPLLVGKRFVSAHLPPGYKKAFSGLSEELCTRLIRDQRIVKLSRRGKYLLFELDSGYLTFHLRMTGRIFQAEPEDRDRKHITAWFCFTDGSHLYFKDVRKFGRIVFSESLDWLEDKLGIEPLNPRFTPIYLVQSLGRKNRAIKGALLDQAVVAGLGNIYVDEALFSAGIHPLQPCSRLSTQDYTKLHNAIVDTINGAISLNGTTFQSFYFGEEETSGEFVGQLQVFGRDGQVCKKCGTTIIKTRVTNRGTHLCPDCQVLVP